jgi:hypothetical protein
MKSTPKNRRVIGMLKVGNNLRSYKNLSLLRIKAV